ncbi:hypothetical protein [Rossellomorea sp. SC111]|uniref:hypothetical protein n=1 Tax=Rossellomorea sp. SC111 TaxID=2968985 RepID=UPI002812770B|nr:hypothetical protein [Rossellomorea sp. SC111]
MIEVSNQRILDERDERNGETGIASKNGSQNKGIHLIKRYIYFSFIFRRFFSPYMDRGILAISESFLI